METINPTNTIITIGVSLTVAYVTMHIKSIHREKEIDIRSD
jgi:hypothetical protein